MTIRVECYAAGRVFRLTCRPVWRWSAAACAGIVLVNVGPLAVTLYRRRVTWFAPDEDHLGGGPAVQRSATALSTRATSTKAPPNALRIPA